MSQKTVMARKRKKIMKRFKTVMARKRKKIMKRFNSSFNYFFTLHPFTRILRGYNTFWGTFLIYAFTIFFNMNVHIICKHILTYIFNHMYFTPN